MDGSVKIEISSDEMSAIAFILSPDEGGRPVEVPDVKKALREAGVVHGIVNNERMQAFCEEGRIIPCDFMAASGTQGGHGEDAVIEYLWKKESDQPADDNQKVDLRELNIVQSVSSGEIIAKKTPPTRGDEATTVTGKKIPGEWGTDVQIKPGPNVELSEDGTEFMATIDGSPKLSGGVLSVDPVYRVNGDVDYSTGNINFAGALEIAGNIADGFVVKANGNITIGGNVQAAEVIAGGDVVVKGGIITRMEGVVSAEGSVSAKFIENSEVEAGGNVTALRAIINSKVRSNAMVVCSSQEGKIMGGDIMAYQEVRAKQLGTEKETKTTLRAGFKYDVYLMMSEVEQRLNEVMEQIERDKKSLANPKANQSDAAGDVKERLQKNEARRLALNNKLTAVRSKVQVNPFATVKGEEFIHPGCQVYIGGAKERIGKPMRFATLSIDKQGGGIALSAYDEMTGKIKTSSIGKKEKKTTVLVVDDAKFMRKKLTDILGNNNFDILDEAEDGKIAVEKYSKLKPDLVTMDITMPNVDGITALKAIKKINPKAKVVMISALGQKDKVKEAIVSGAMDFVIKPFVPEKVVEVLSRVAKK